MKMNMQNIMQQAQKMQEEMERVKREAEQKIVEAEAGGGMVKVKMNGANQIVEIKISEDIVDPEDIEMLEDLVVAAVNKAQQDASAMMEEEMQKITGNLPNIPGMNF